MKRNYVYWRNSNTGIGHRCIITGKRHNQYCDYISCSCDIIFCMVLFPYALSQNNEFILWLQIYNIDDILLSDHRISVFYYVLTISRCSTLRQILDVGLILTFNGVIYKSKIWDRRIRPIAMSYVVPLTVMLVFCSIYTFFNSKLKLRVKYSILSKKDTVEVHWD